MLRATLLPRSRRWGCNSSIVEVASGGSIWSAGISSWRHEDAAHYLCPLGPIGPESHLYEPHYFETCWKHPQSESFSRFQHPQAAVFCSMCSRVLCELVAADGLTMRLFRSVNHSLMRSGCSISRTSSPYEPKQLQLRHRMKVVRSTTHCIALHRSDCTGLGLPRKR